jgi:electron transport complex protein RnfG
MEIRRIIKEAMILFVITLVSGLLLGLAYQITKGPIEERENEQKKAAYQSVFSEAEKFVSSEQIEANVADSEAILKAAGITGVTVTECLAAQDAAGVTLGYVMNLSFAGSQGPMTMAYGWSVDGTTKGIDILTSTETAKMGALADEPEFKSQFELKQTDKFSLSDNVDVISGATITSEAVVNAANAGIAFAKYCAKGE